jgi:hypothetical protein
VTDQDAEFEVRAQLAEDAAMTGEWSSAATAQKKFAEWVGLYARGAVVITLTVRTSGCPAVILRRWPDAPDKVGEGGALR